VILPPFINSVYAKILTPLTVRELLALILVAVKVVPEKVREELVVVDPLPLPIISCPAVLFIV